MASPELSRWDDLVLLQKAYPTFQPFLYDVMTSLLGFDCSDVQLDIADYLENGPLYRMIQAQRGQAKTTITAAYAVWRIIHKPNNRVLIVSAGGPMAKEIAGWIIQIINGMEVLECLRPDKSMGDKSSIEAFDIHYSLKGPEKSPSIACVGITATLQGKRADILIADDIESQKNSQTELMRERLQHLTKDFSSINSLGDIVFLGTPQSIDSIYNGLAGRGYDIRVWTGRYPTVKEQLNYGNTLAPFIIAKMEADPSLRTGGGLTGKRGKPIDPVILPEEVLTKKEIDQGAAYFQLQHMLDTRLSDAARFPLKSSRIIFMHIPEKTVPMEVNFMQMPEMLVHTPQDFPLEDLYYRASSFGPEFGAFQGTHMYVDPAGGGQNGDETAYAVTKFAAGKIYVVACGGVRGGLDDASLNALTAIAVRWKPSLIEVEENFGKGALESVWRPKLIKQHACHIEGVWESGQKEKRIVDIIEPILGSGRLCMDESLLTTDWEGVQHYPLQLRSSYSLFYQLSRITLDKDSLRHDDRLDALAGSCRHWITYLAQDSEKMAKKAKAKAHREMLKDPLGDGSTKKSFKLLRVRKGRIASTDRMRRTV